MRRKYFQPGWQVLLAVLFLCAAARTTQAQTNKPSGASLAKIIDFQSPGNYYEPPFQQQMKYLVQGAQAQPLANACYLINQLKLTTFQTNGGVEMIIAAADCVLDSKSHVAASPGPLSVRTADGRFFLEGQGFAWVQSESSLNISNRVHTVIHQGLSATNAAPQMAEDMEVFSDHFVYNQKTGQSVYRDNVRVAGTNLTLTAGELSLSLSLPMTNNVITLKGRPTWSSGQRNGGGDVLEFDRVNNSLRATGNSYVKMPGTVMGTNAQAGAAGKSFEVLADNYELRTNGATFIGNVRVTQFAGDQPAGKMNCGVMTVALKPPGEIQWLVAENNVVVEQDDGRFTGATALFTATNSVVQFSGNPTWSKGGRNGSGDGVFVDQARNEMTVRGNARMKLPRGDMKTGAIPQGGMAATADKIVTITSDEYVVKSGRAAFRGQVRIEDAQMQIASDLLTADSLAGGEQIERITAERNVVADLKDSNGTNTHVTADRALYTVSDSFLRLTGSPVVQNERGTLTGSIIVWDRAYDLLIVRNQKMVFQASGPGEEAFPSFQSKAKK